MTTITNTGEPFDLDIKRFYIGGVTIKHNCSGCGHEIIEDLGEKYLMNSEINTPMSKWMWCPECSQEDEIKIRINLSVELL